MWSYIFTAVVGFSLYGVISSLSKRLEKIEEDRGPGYSFPFNVNAVEAVMSHLKFGELTGIKSAGKGLSYKDWTKADQELWHKKFAKNVSDKAFVHFHYLASEGLYFVSTNSGKSNRSGFTRRDGLNNLLYSAIVVGDENGFDPYIELNIYERLIKMSDGSRGWVLTPCLTYHEDIRGRDFKALFDFPMHRLDISDEKFKEMGFDVKRRGGDDVFTDEFGEMERIPTFHTISKNGAEVSFVS